MFSPSFKQGDPLMSDDIGMSPTGQGEGPPSDTFGRWTTLDAARGRYLPLQGARCREESWGVGRVTAFHPPFRRGPKPAVPVGFLGEGVSFANGSANADPLGRLRNQRFSITHRVGVSPVPCERTSCQRHHWHSGSKRGGAPDWCLWKGGPAIYPGGLWVSPNTLRGRLWGPNNVSCLVRLRFGIR